MRALSYWQPWAWLVANGFKPVENRRWNTHVRGEHLIHAAQRLTVEDYDFACEFAHDVNPAIRVPHFDELERGGIVGVATIVDVIAPCLRAEELERAPCACGRPWHMGHQYGFLLEDARPLPFRAYRGAQRWFNVPDPQVSVTMTMMSLEVNGSPEAVRQITGTVWKLLGGG